MSKNIKMLVTAIVICCMMLINAIPASANSNDYAGWGSRYTYVDKAWSYLSVFEPTQLDLTTAQKVVARMVTGEYFQRRYDVNQDGKVDVRDLVQIARWANVSNFKINYQGVTYAHSLKPRKNITHNEIQQVTEAVKNDSQRLELIKKFDYSLNGCLDTADIKIMETAYNAYTPNFVYSEGERISETELFYLLDAAEKAGMEYVKLSSNAEKKNVGNAIVYYPEMQGLPMYTAQDFGIFEKLFFDFEDSEFVTPELFDAEGSRISSCVQWTPEGTWRRLENLPTPKFYLVPMLTDCKTEIPMREFAYPTFGSLK